MRAALPQDPAQHPTPTERATARPKSGYLPTLDGWRALAILWVIYAHLGRHFGPISHAIEDAGERGVQLFFALSGFLICTRLLREERSFGSISLKSFYTRRVQIRKPERAKKSCTPRSPASSIAWLMGPK